LLTKDHTVAAQLLEHGLLKGPQVRSHPEAHVLTRSLGQAEEISLEFAEAIALRQDDAVLLCSDGLSGTLEDGEIASILAAQTDLNATVQKLCEAALERGSKDNVSVQYLQLAEETAGVQQGVQIGRYILERKLGQGGMGQVWLGRHIDIKSPAAIKIMRPDRARDERMRRRFLTEGKRQAALDHPAIVKVLGYDEASIAGEPIAFLILQYIEGESLYSRLKSPGKGSLAPEEFAGISCRVLDALDSAHRAGLVHRDVKSADILLDREGEAYLGDFGLVRSMEPQEGGATTTTTQVMGTPEYMAPEQIVSPTKVDARSDLYSFGCVLYEMLAGKTPFGDRRSDSITLARLSSCWLSALPGFCTSRPQAF
jgi:hypothetical protein